MILGVSLTERRSRSLTGAWIETDSRQPLFGLSFRRSLTGAWIETNVRTGCENSDCVAPSRERGLKLPSVAITVLIFRRSLTGAWIETKVFRKSEKTECVAPSRERGLKSGKENPGPGGERN